MKIRINRAPVLTLWATIVAERLGFEHAEALTLGRAVAGMNAYSKGKSLGLFRPTPESVRAERRRKAKTVGIFEVGLMHRALPVQRTPDGLRAVAKGKPVDPTAVRRYLEGKFGEALGEVSTAMIELAVSRDAEDLAAEAFALYEKFRPVIPTGEAGWGAKGELDTRSITALARR